ncbi:MAG TPA: family 1 encapsulin nanocompartment shell protein, partial [Usitatibacter sp.]|nr:family 1 encapsulin nanocompartment shell protein [Usitatibacter sp.]
MNHLLRELAPIPADAWRQIDEEAKRTLKAMLAARKLVDFDGPLGWQASSANLGRTASIAAPRKGLDARLREVLPLVELRVPFEMAREEIDAIARGAKDADLDPVREAARSAGLAEDHAVFHGFRDARIDGIVEAAAQGRCTITKDYQAYLGVVAEALQKLRDRGVGG